MPINHNHATFINLDLGEQIVIEKDTDHLWQPKEGRHPMTCLKLEAGGNCIYYHLEDGVWYCSEYEGDSSAKPQLKIKFEASESEKNAREAAKAEWELRMGGSTKGNATGGGIGLSTVTAPNFPTGPDGRAPSYETDYSMAMPEPIARPMGSGSAYGPVFPQAPTLTQESLNFPQATVNTQQNVWQQGTSSPVYPQFPSVVVGTDARRTGEYGYPGTTADTVQQRNMPEASVPSPFFPVAPATPTPLLNSLPMPSIQESGGRTAFNGGGFHHVGGHISTIGTNNANNISGSGETVDWAPDLHKESNGTYRMP